MNAEGFLEQKCLEKSPEEDADNLKKFKGGEKQLCCGKRKRLGNISKDPEVIRHMVR